MYRSSLMSPPPTHTHTTPRTFTVPYKLLFCFGINSKGPLTPGTVWEVLGVFLWRRWGRMSRHVGMLQGWSDITGRWCRVGPTDPRRLSTGYIADGRFGFSAAPPVSWHGSCACGVGADSKRESKEVILQTLEQPWRSRMQTQSRVTALAQMQHRGVNNGHKHTSFIENKGIKGKKNSVVAD